MVILSIMAFFISYASLTASAPITETIFDNSSDNSKGHTSVLDYPLISGNVFTHPLYGGLVLLTENHNNQPVHQVSPISEPVVQSSSSKVSPMMLQNPWLQQVSQAQDEIKYNAADSRTVMDTGTPLLYSIKASASMPIHDDDFQDFIEYGFSMSFGVEKQVTPKLSLVGEAELIMMTGNWTIKGDRASIKIAAEEMTYSGNPNINIVPPGEVVPEDVDETQGAGYWSGGGINIESAESLKKIDIETTMLLFPVSINGYFWPLKGKKLNPYIGGGIGMCLAQRYADSRAIKDKYFEGPEYFISVNESEFNHGLFIQMFAGVYYPLRNNIIFIAQGKTAFYNMKNFKPIFTVSFKDETRSLEDPSIVTYSYEKPLEVGIIEDVFISSLAVGLLIPF